MRCILQSFAIGAIAFGSLTFGCSFATAQDVEFRIGPDGVRVYDRDRERERDRYDYDRRDRGRGGCNPGLALDRARDAGLTRVSIASQNARSITVQGVTDRGRDRMIFANTRGCPEIG